MRKNLKFKFVSFFLIFSIVFSLLPSLNTLQATSTHTWTTTENFITDIDILQLRTLNNKVVLNSRRSDVISIGWYHALALKDDGTMQVVGYNGYGELGLGNEIDSYDFTQMGADTWRVVAAGGDYSLGIKTNGTLWAWGYNGYGQLGLGDKLDRNTPTQVGSDNSWVDVVVGAYGHAIGLKSNGTLWAWGYNSDDDEWPLGLGQEVDEALVPTQIGTDTDWVSISTGRSHSVALKNNGTLWSWGENWEGSLGLGDENIRYTPVQIGTDTDWVKADAGYHYTIAIKADGTLWSWGNNSLGQLGLGDTTKRILPTQVGIDHTWSLVSLSNYNESSFAIKEDGTLWSWGSNIGGELGLNDKIDRYEPVQVGSDSDWVQLSANSGSNKSSVLSIKENQTLWGWGLNDNGCGDGCGQAGLGDGVLEALVPTQVGSETDWAQPTDTYVASGTLSNLTYDAGSEVIWSELLWSTDSLPSGTSIKFKVRTSDDGSNYSAWSEYFTQNNTSSTSGEGNLSGVNPSRYIQLEATLSTSDTSVTPTLNSFSVNYIEPSTGSRAKNDRLIPLDDVIKIVATTTINTATTTAEEVKKQLILSIDKLLRLQMRLLIDLISDEIEVLNRETTQSP